MVNSFSNAIYIPGGFKFGQNNHTTVYVREEDVHNDSLLLLSFQVSSNGFFTFYSTVSYNTPQLFSPTSPSAYIVAPFWANNDLLNRIGSISYEVHNSETSSSYIGQVSAHISQQQQVRFNGSWMLLAEWKNVSLFGGDPTIVSR